MLITGATESACSAVAAVLEWLNAWVRTPGFGGFAVVVGAGLAYRAASKTRDGENERAREQRWWEQARWATEQAWSEEPSSQALGIAALAHLVEEDPDVEAATFAFRAMEVFFDEGLVEVIDEPADDSGDLHDDEEATNG